MKICLLVDYPENLSHIAGWVFDEWGQHIPGMTLEKTIEKYRTHLRRDTIPLTLIAVESGVPIGTASLVEHDMPTRLELYPWLASVYVVPGWRHLEVGRNLVHRAEEEAQRLRIGKLYLFTPDRMRFYSQQGWKELERTNYRGREVTIMYKGLET
jgi:GNAT superfamily N-acetyltransferase